MLVRFKLGDPAFSILFGGGNAYLHMVSVIALAPDLICIEFKPLRHLLRESLDHGSAIRLRPFAWNIDEIAIPMSEVSADVLGTGYVSVN